MVDIKFIIENLELVKNSTLAKGYSVDYDAIINLYKKINITKTQLDKARHDKNVLSDKFYMISRVNNEEEWMKLREKVSKVDTDIYTEQLILKDSEDLLRTLVLGIPNILHVSVPIGINSDDNIVIKLVESKDEYDFVLSDHVSICERLNLVSFRKGANITSSGFIFFIDKGAILQRALINFFLDMGQKNGYTQMSPPFLVNEESARGTGQLPDKEKIMFDITDEDLYPIPTAEVPVTNFHKDEFIDPKRLPIKYVAYSPCFRKEAGSHGSLTRGLNRLHQFDKVELVKFTDQESSYEELDKLRDNVEEIIQLLGLDYRILLMCSKETGFAQSKKYDFEVFSPGQKKWLEVSSCSNYETFQSRRMSIKYISKEGNKFVHTINGSGLAIPRIMAALLEKNQTKDGDILIPKCLQPYTKFEKI